MLKLKKFIAKGATRMCFEHPDNPNLCVRVAIDEKKLKHSQNELRAYNKLKDKLAPFIINYETELTDTNYGKGLVCELLKDDDGQYSKPLSYYRNNLALDEEIRWLLDSFVSKVLPDLSLLFYDFNVNNFLVQIKKGKKYLYYSDLKSYNSYKAWTFLRIENLIPGLGKFAMVRRLKKLYEILGLEWNQPTFFQYVGRQIFHKKEG